MPIPANQITHVEVFAKMIATSGGSNNRNLSPVFVYRRTSTVNPVTKAAFESVFQSTVCIPLLAALNNRVTQVANDVRWVNDALDAPVPVARAVVGGVAGDSMAMQAAVYVLFRTGLRGKSYRGSKHFGVISEADTTAPDSDILNAAALARFATLVTALGTPLVDANGNTWVPSILSRIQSKLVKNPTDVKANDVSLVLLNKRIGRMSRREVKSVY